MAGKIMPPRAAIAGRRICLGWLRVVVISSPIKKKKIAIAKSKAMSSYYKESKKPRRIFDGAF